MNEVMIDTSSGVSARRKNKLKREEEELQELLKKANQEKPVEEKPEEEHQTQSTEDAGKEASGTETVKKEEEKEELSPEEKNWKKRYGDLRKREQELLSKIHALETGATDNEVPADPELLKKWVEEHPQVASFVKTMAKGIVDKEMEATKAKLTEISEREEKLILKEMEDQVKSKHKDFDKIKDADEFHTWAEEQPKWIQDAIYENSNDAKSLIRAIDLYKADTRKPEPLMSTNSRHKTSINTDGDKKIWTREEIASMSLKEFEKNVKEIEKANKEGRIKN